MDHKNIWLGVFSVFRVRVRTFQRCVRVCVCVSVTFECHLSINFTRETTDVSRTYTYEYKNKTIWSIIHNINGKQKSYTCFSLTARMLVVSHGIIFGLCFSPAEPYLVPCLELVSLLFYCIRTISIANASSQYWLNEICLLPCVYRWRSTTIKTSWTCFLFSLQFKCILNGHTHTGTYTCINIHVRTQCSNEHEHDCVFCRCLVCRQFTSPQPDYRRPPFTCHSSICRKIEKSKRVKIVKWKPTTGDTGVLRISMQTLLLLASA